MYENFEALLSLLRREQMQIKTSFVYFSVCFIYISLVK